MTKETFAFQAEVGKLLDIVARSLYSHKEIFLRELVSNASDACDKLRYAALTDDSLKGVSQDFRIVISADDKARTLTASDNGIGMNRDELSDLLGTIARSGTQAFAAQLEAGKTPDMTLIGQFGVGFYSAFMVADKVEVVTRKAGDEAAWRWESDGKGEYTIADAERDGPGTDVTLHLAKGEKEFVEESRIRTIVHTYSDHVGVPIVFRRKDGTEETLNTASALWTRDKKDIDADQYKEFYHHVAHAFDEPWLTLHNRVEGVVSYTNLLFVPSTRPWDLFDPERKPHVKLYVNRVFVTDDCEGLLPSYLRFLRGVIDSEDLTLNISREMLQRDPKLAKIRSGVVKRVLGELKKKAEKQPDDYATFWDTFGAVLKEGLYEDPENRERLLDLVRFRTTAGEDLAGLAGYVERMKDGQEAIYYITGDDARQLERSPQLEGFRAKGVEVLLLSDPIDDFWISAVDRYAEKPFRSVTRGGADLDAIGGETTEKDEDAKDTGDLDALVARFKLALGDSVKDVRASTRLTDSAVCLVADEGDMDMHLERMLKMHHQLSDGEVSPRIMELNPKHALVRRLADIAKQSEGGNALLDDAARLLLDQARIIEGEPVSDPQAFARRMSTMLEKGLAA